MRAESRYSLVSIGLVSLLIGGGLWEGCSGQEAAPPQKGSKSLDLQSIFKDMAARKALPVAKTFIAPYGRWEITLDKPGFAATLHDQSGQVLSTPLNVDTVMDAILGPSESLYMVTGTNGTIQVEKAGQRLIVKTIAQQQSLMVVHHLLGYGKDGLWCLAERSVPETGLTGSHHFERKVGVVLPGSGDRWEWKDAPPPQESSKQTFGGLPDFVFSDNLGNGFYWVEQRVAPGSVTFATVIHDPKVSGWRVLEQPAIGIYPIALIYLGGKIIPLDDTLPEYRAFMGKQPLGENMLSIRNLYFTLPRWHEICFLRGHFARTSPDGKEGLAVNVLDCDKGIVRELKVLPRDSYIVGIGIFQGQIYCWPEGFIAKDKLIQFSMPKE
jgi:hypothetical protein